MVMCLHTDIRTYVYGICLLLFIFLVYCPVVKTSVTFSILYLFTEQFAQVNLYPINYILFEFILNNFSTCNISNV